MSVEIFSVMAVSLESIRRVPSPTRAMSDELRFERMSEAEKPKPTEIARFFTRANAEKFVAALHGSWHRPHIVTTTETREAQHYAHGGERGLGL